MTYNVDGDGCAGPGRVILANHEPICGVEAERLIEPQVSDVARHEPRRTGLLVSLCRFRVRYAFVLSLYCNSPAASPSGLEQKHIPDLGIVGQSSGC